MKPEVIENQLEVNGDRIGGGKSVPSVAVDNCKCGFDRFNVCDTGIVEVTVQEKQGIIPLFTVVHGAGHDGIHRETVHRSVAGLNDDAPARIVLNANLDLRAKDIALQVEVADQNDLDAIPIDELNLALGSGAGVGFGVGNSRRGGLASG